MRLWDIALVLLILLWLPIIMGVLVVMWLLSPRKGDKKILCMCLAEVEKPRDYTRLHEINTEILWKSV